MNEMFYSKKTDFSHKLMTRAIVEESRQLTFHYSEELQKRFQLEEVHQEDLAELKLAEIKKISECFGKIQAIRMVEELTIANLARISEQQVLEEVRVPEVERAPSPSPAPDIEVTPEIYPFLGLQLQNQESVYNIGKSFLNDIKKGQKHFGFAHLEKASSAESLLAYGSFTHYNLKAPVLIVVRDLRSKAFDKYRREFTNGTLWKWDTFDWGSLCLVDHKEIKKNSDEFSQIDFAPYLQEFQAVFWELSPENIQAQFHKATLPILKQIDSVTFLVSKNKTKSAQIKKASAYFECFSVPLKGILMTGEGGDV